MSKSNLLVAYLAYFFLFNISLFASSGDFENRLRQAGCTTLCSKLVNIWKPGKPTEVWT